MSAVLAVEGLGLRFGAVTVLDGVTFTVEAGERLALLGPNGAGKTSVLNCISGAVRPGAGRVVLEGRDLDRVPPRRRAALGVARTFQSLGVVDDLDVGANLLLGRHPRLRAGLVATALALPAARGEEAGARRRCAEVARALDLDAAARAGDLPAGARKRLELGRALAADPVLLLLDEPFAGTSVAEQQLMAAAIRAAADRGVAVVVVDHHVDALLAFASRRVELDGGRMAATAP
ncbi:MAG: ABC transporter ATP-binding protein [Acidimicrobiia bacterium]